MSWFEPPTVCRWETDEELAETKKMELKIQKSSVDEDDVEPPPKGNKKQQMKKEDSTKSAPPQPPPFVKKMKIVEDFNLLDIPEKVCLQELFEEFVIPMIPEGYEINFQQSRVARNLKIDDEESKKMYTIDDIVYQTKCSKYLFPNCETRKVLKIVKVFSSYICFY